MAVGDYQEEMESRAALIDYARKRDISLRDAFAIAAMIRGIAPRQVYEWADSALSARSK